MKLTVGVGDEQDEIEGVHDVEIMDGDHLMIRRKSDLDNWLTIHTTPKGVFVIEGNLTIEMCKLGPSNPVLTLNTRKITGGRWGFEFDERDGCQGCWLTYGLWPHVFVSDLIAGKEDALGQEESRQEVGRQQAVLI